MGGAGDSGVVVASAPARVALAGNPSDGFGGRTLSLAISNFAATVRVAPSEELEIVPAEQDQIRFDGVAALVRDVRDFGYYGGLRLLKASVKRLSEHCAERGIDISERRFSITYETAIPRGVGLGGSSAIVTAAMRALAEFLEIKLDRATLPELVMSVEVDELGIPAGPQDRVAQVYEGLTYMDFDPALASRNGDARYETLDPALLPPLFVAHVEAAAEPSAIFHSDLRRRFDEGDAEIVEAMDRLAGLARRARDAVLAGDRGALGRAMTESFEMRRAIAALDPRHVRLVELAREHGADANYAGSGGAIAGTYESTDHLAELERAYRAEGFDIEPCAVSPAR